MGLFEGIGGFSIAGRWAGWSTPIMVEWNPYCQAVLLKNFPNTQIHGDIRTFDARPWRGRIDIITGGFPCQPVSQAGKRLGRADDRFLWPQMLRIIREVAPPWVIAENVAGLLTMDGGRVFDGILTDLENEGYFTETYCIPAVGIGAPHERERVWIVAHRDRILNDGNLGRHGLREELTNGNCYAAADPVGQRRKRGTNNEGPRAQSRKRPTENDWFTADPGCKGLQRREQPGTSETPARPSRPATEYNSNVTEITTNPDGWRRHKTLLENDLQRRQSDFNKPGWIEHWFKAATRLCRVDDGFSSGLDGTGTIPPTAPKKKKGKGHRIEALGNAIVPQIAYELFTAINIFEDDSHG